MSKTGGVNRDGVGSLPSIPAKRYFTIGEVSDLCAVKPHVLRYWEQEFTQLKPIKRRGNRRYYQHHEVLLIRRIRELLYEEGFTINGARNRLDGGSAASSARRRIRRDPESISGGTARESTAVKTAAPKESNETQIQAMDFMRAELESIRALLTRRPTDSVPG